MRTLLTGHRVKRANGQTAKTLGRVTIFGMFQAQIKKYKMLQLHLRASYTRNGQQKYLGVFAFNNGSFDQQTEDYFYNYYNELFLNQNRVWLPRT